MRSQLAAIAFFLSEAVIAHPGHGKPGFFHEHAYGLAELALAVFGLSVVVLVCRAILRKASRR